MLKRFALLGQSPMNFFGVKIPIQVRTDGVAGLLIQEIFDSSCVIVGRKLLNPFSYKDYAVINFYRFSFRAAAPP